MSIYGFCVKTHRIQVFLVVQNYSEGGFVLSINNILLQRAKKLIFCPNSRSGVWRSLHLPGLCSDQFGSQDQRCSSELLQGGQGGFYGRDQVLQLLPENPKHNESLFKAE